MKAGFNGVRKSNVRTRWKSTGSKSLGPGTFNGLLSKLSALGLPRSDVALSRYVERSAGEAYRHVVAVEAETKVSW
jgi:hypothetical protein